MTDLPRRALLIIGLPRCCDDCCFQEEEEEEEEE